MTTHAHVLIAHPELWLCWFQLIGDMGTPLVCAVPGFRRRGCGQVHPAGGPGWAAVAQRFGQRRGRPVSAHCSRAG